MSTQNSNLLKEAIADAKAVRATALANAKAALEEAFNQRFSAVFADKLREDSAVESSTEVPVIPVAESSDKDKVGATKPSGDKNDVNWNKNGDPAAKSTVKNITPNTIPAAKDGGDATKRWSKNNKGNAMDGTPNGVKENYEEEGKREEEEEGKREEEEEGKREEEEAVEETVTNEDLDEIIRELEAEAGNSSVDNPAVGGAQSGEVPPEGGAPEVETPSEDATEIHSGDTVTISKVEPSTSTAEKPPVGGEEPGAEALPTEEEMSTSEMEEDIDLNELLASLNEEAKEEEEENVEKNKKEEEEGKIEEALKAKLNEAISQRDEAYKTVEYLKTQINEINLLNAKLLYTNKLFKEFGMNHDQKVKVVEAFDLTKNVREVKMTYANWCESLNFGGKAQRRPQFQSNVQMVTEGAASKTVASTKPSKQVITEGVNEMADRFKKLAGIKSVK